MLTMRDMTSFQQLSETKREVQMAQMVSSTVSHEMMTPLGCVEDFAERIKVSNNKEEVLEWCALIIRAVCMLRFGMRDMLDRSHINRGTFSTNLEVCRPYELLS